MLNVIIVKQLTTSTHQKIVSKKIQYGKLISVHLTVILVMTTENKVPKTKTFVTGDLVHVVIKTMVTLVSLITQLNNVMINVPLCLVPILVTPTVMFNVTCVFQVTT
jgi:membrane protein required for beta-lactamase induction